MANFARIDATTHEVLEILVLNNEDVGDLEFPESEPVGVEFLKSWDKDGTYWKQTSFSDSFRKMYAFIGGFYHPEGDFFYRPQPHPSWTLDLTEQDWVAPLAKPADTYNESGEPTTYYLWDEDLYNSDNSQGWVDVYANIHSP